MSVADVEKMRRKTNHLCVEAQEIFTLILKLVTEGFMSLIYE